MSVAVYPSPREGALPFAAAILGLIICAIALPMVLIFRGPFAGWLLGTVLWIGNWSVAQMATKISLGTSSPAAAVGISGVSVMARAFVVVIILYAVAARVSQPVGLTAAIVFLAAFSFDLMGRVLLFSLNEHARQNPDEKGPSDQ